MILVTGGTGFLGSHLLAFLVKSGSTVRAIHRKDSDFTDAIDVFKSYGLTKQILQTKIEWKEASLLDVPSLSEVFIGVSNVYHCAALVSFNEVDDDAMLKTNVEGTANVVNLCLSHNVLKLCHVSSIAATGKSITNAPVTEETEWNPELRHSGYAISKYGAEMEVWRGAQEGLTVTIVQPGVILGEGHWQEGLGSFFKRLEKGLTYYPSGSTGVVDVVDVCKAMILVMQDGNLVNQSYILVAQNLPFRTFFNDVALALKTTPPRKKIAKRTLLILSRIDGFLSVLGLKKRSLTTTTVRALYSTTTYDGSKIECIDDFKYTSLDATIARVFDAYNKASS